MEKKENFKKSYINKINQNLEFFTEYEYIYKKNRLFNQLSNENLDLYNHSKNKNNLKNRDFKNLYNKAVNISYGIDHIADTIGLFTRKIKHPIIESEHNKGNTPYIDFNCGDLFLRKNVIFKKDNIYCYNFFSDFVNKIEDKLKQFRWSMNYQMPISKIQITKLIKTQTKKHCLYNPPVWIHTIQYNWDLNGGKRDDILYISADLIWTDLKAVIKLVKKLHKVKEIIFIDYPIVFEPAKYNHKLELRDYIIDICKNHKFGKFSSTPNLKNKTHLNKLYNFRKEINKNIEIHFFNNDYYDKSELVPLLHDAKFI